MVPKVVSGGLWHQMALSCIDLSREKIIAFQLYFTPDDSGEKGLVWYLRHLCNSISLSL